MNHTDPTGWPITDWVAHYEHEYPHMVKIPYETRNVFERHDWLNLNVGERGLAWEFPKSDTYMFKNTDHAVQFALIFS
jgi:hypothetical protein